MIAFVADVHLWNHKQFAGEVAAGINRRAQMILDVFQSACETALDEECQKLVVLGDMVDGVRPEPQLLSALMDVVTAAEGEGLNVVFMKGNHDQVSDDPGDHALGPLGYEARVVDRAVASYYDDLGVYLWYVPFQAGYARTWLPNTIRQMPCAGVRQPKTRKVLCIHLGVEDDKTPPWLHGAHDSITLPHLAELMKKHDFSHVFAGNWHDGRSWNVKDGKLTRQIHQVGALVPTGFNNPGHDYGFMCILREDGSVSRLQLPGPRFIKVDDTWMINGDQKDPWPAECTYYVHAEVAPANLAARREAMAQLLSAGAVAGGKVTPNSQVAVKQAREAAAAARTSTSVTDSVSAYVKKMPLDEGVSRDNVQGHMARFLGL